jgi:hypothetical protein
MNKVIILQQEIKYTAVDFTKPIVTDDPIKKIVTAKVNMIADDGQQYDYPLITMWSGADYDTAGQWTDTDLKNKLLQILNS